MTLESYLREKRDAGQKLLGIYITAGATVDWTEHVKAAIDGGADFVEIGLPFSDPIMDGPIIQAASLRALHRGVTTESLLSELAEKEFDVPLVVMTYYNVIYSLGLDRAAEMLSAAGITGSIIPDLPFDAREDWIEIAERAGIADVLLAAPSTTDQRLKEIATNSSGFIYAVGVMGVTGTRSELATTATDVARRLSKITDKAVLVGVGISTPEQAREVSEVADGVIVGSAVVKAILDGMFPIDVGSIVAKFNAAIK